MVSTFTVDTKKYYENKKKGRNNTRDPRGCL